MQVKHEDFLEHFWVAGATGSGKSSFIQTLARQVINEGHGICIVDPHGSLYAEMLAWLATKSSRVKERVILFNPLDPKWAIGFNPLQLKPNSESAERKSSLLADMISKIFKADPMITVRMRRIMYHSFWLLMVHDLTLLEFHSLVTDEDYRSKLLSSLPDNHKLIKFWENEFPKNEKTRIEWSQSSLNKIDALADDPDFKLIFGQRQSTIDFQDILNNGKILLVNIPKGHLGDTASRLFGGFIVAQIQQEAMKRADNPFVSHPIFHLILDEFQNFVTDDIETMLTELRKAKIAVMLANQNYTQLEDNPKLQSAIRNSIGNLILFQTGTEDAEIFARDMFAPDLDMVKDVHLRYLDDELIAENVYRSLSEIHELTLRQITSLNKREFFYYRRGKPPARKMRTFNLPPTRLTPFLQSKITSLIDSRGIAHASFKEEAYQEIEIRSIEITEPEDPHPSYQVLGNEDQVLYSIENPLLTRLDTKKTRDYTKRDREILSTLFNYDKVLSKEQIITMFLSDLATTTQRNVLKRMVDHEYLQTNGAVYWLGMAGAQHIAAEMGMHYKDREFGFESKPRLDASFLPHLIDQNDFRILFEKAVSLTPEFQLIDWHNESFFRKNRDSPAYIKLNGDKSKREIRPDGLAVVSLTIGKHTIISRLAFELDRRASHGINDFIDDKVLPFIEYIKGSTYEARFGHQSGRWITIIRRAGMKRLLNLKKATEKAAGTHASLFLFALYDDCFPDEKLLKSPIFYQAGMDDTTTLPLFDYQEISSLLPPY